MIRAAVTAFASHAQAADFRSRYWCAFAAFLLDQGEHTRHAAYELGRDAVAQGISVLDVSNTHHETLRELLRGWPRPDVDHLISCAAEFLVETLSAFEMVQRTYREATERAVLEQRHAAMLRRLSTLLSDTSLAAGAADSLAEALQLVAEQARELTGASACIARARIGDRGNWVTAAAEEEGFETPRDRSEVVRLSVPVVSLAGSEIGRLEVVRRGGRFSELDEAVLVHVGQMAAATIERARV
jgi:hypothetical protein